MALNLIEFQSTDHFTLPGLLYEPHKKPQTAVLFLHGMGSTSVFYNTVRFNTLARHFEKAGISLLAFNNRGAHFMKKLTRYKDTEVEDGVIMGTSYEVIKDCIHDIDGAVKFLKKRGYKKFVLMGHSTGANKVCVYNFYTSRNPIHGYVLWAGGDDTGIFYQQLGGKKFERALKQCEEHIKNERGRKLMPKYLVGEFPISYQSFYDICNPDGDYNVFPFYEALNRKKLSKKPLFQEYRSIEKPTLVIYGGEDEYCYGKVPKIMSLLRKKCSAPKRFTFSLVRGADHGFDGFEDELARQITHWIIK